MISPMWIAVIGLAARAQPPASTDGLPISSSGQGMVVYPDGESCGWSCEVDRAWDQLLQVHEAWLVTTYSSQVTATLGGSGGPNMDLDAQVQGLLAIADIHAATDQAGGQALEMIELADWWAVIPAARSHQASTTDRLMAQVSTVCGPPSQPGVQRVENELEQWVRSTASAEVSAKERTASEDRALRAWRQAFPGCSRSDNLEAEGEVSILSEYRLAYYASLVPPQASAIPNYLAAVKAFRQERLRQAEVIGRRSLGDIAEGRQAYSDDPTLGLAMRRIAAQLGELYLQLNSRQQRVTHEQWCRVVVGSAVAGTMVGSPGVSELVDQAVGSHDSACFPELRPFLRGPSVLGAWTDSTHRLLRNGTAEVLIAVPPDEWVTIDGTEVTGFGPQVVPLPAGVHRFEQSLANVRVAGLMTVHSGLVYRLHATSSGLTLLPLGASPPSLGEGPLPLPEPASGSGLPVSADDPPQDAPHAPVGQNAERREIVGVAQSWLRLEGRDHMGPTVFARARVRSDGPLSVDVGVAHDHLGSPVEYRYTDGYSAPVLMRERLTAALVWPLPKLEVAMGASLGILPPINGGVGEVNAYVSWRASERLDFQGGAGLGTFLWNDGWELPVPSAHVALGLRP